MWYPKNVCFMIVELGKFMLGVPKNVVLTTMSIPYTMSNNFIF